MITVFPACAGMNRLASDDCAARTCVPRVRGDEPPSTVGVAAAVSCSPRARG